MYPKSICCLCLKKNHYIRNLKKIMKSEKILSDDLRLKMSAIKD